MKGQSKGYPSADLLHRCHFRLLQLGSRRGIPGQRNDPVWNKPRTMEHNEIWHVWRGVGYIQKEGAEAIRFNSGSLLFLKADSRYESWQDLEDPACITHISFQVLDDEGSPVTELFPDALPTTLARTREMLFDSMLRRIQELHWEMFNEQRGKKLPPERRYVAGYWDVDMKFRFWESAPLFTNLRIPAETPDGFLGSLADNLFKSLVLEFLYQAEHEQTPYRSGVSLRHRQIIQNILCTIEDDNQSTPTVEALAKTAGYGINHFTRIFTKVVGKPPKEYITDLRIRRAKDLLANSDRSLKEVAIQVGYQSPAFFSRQFKLKEGISPSEFRRTGKMATQG
ncbi:helix-turn-helix domain-containing protein [Cerasicoccus fimbriatus]|uniref:helix-turn-helix domain-containing protein n=1 Tax=Cerasicoccus fimbriatus TaxID=3014554 RepID=UPI0022B2C362|nr:helix-turn-helix transcriptional regulator [Cerasicoccus sp. TK19100]